MITTTSSNSIISCSSRSSYSSQKRSDSNDAFYPQSKSSRRLAPPPYPSSFTAALGSTSPMRTEGDSSPAPTSSESRAAASTTSTASHRDTLTCCTCRKSRCLKLYCACFKSQEYCNMECTCYNCCNNPRHEEEREETISMMKAKNPHCFENHVDKRVSEGGWIEE